MRFKSFLLTMIVALSISQGNSQTTDIDSVVNYLIGTWKWETYRGGLAGLPPTQAPDNYHFILNNDASLDSNELYIDAYIDDSLIGSGTVFVEIDTSNWWMPYSVTPGLVGLVYGVVDSTPVDFEILDEDLIELTHTQIADDFIYSWRRDSTFFPGSTEIDSLINFLDGTWKWEYYSGGFAGLPLTFTDTIFHVRFSQDAIDSANRTLTYHAFADSVLVATGRTEVFISIAANWFSQYYLTPDPIAAATGLGTNTLQIEFQPFQDSLVFTHVQLPDDFFYHFLRDSSFTGNGNPGPSSLVWPGDANNDGIANNNDILALGLAFGSSGTTRANASIFWSGQLSADWNDTIPGGIDKKYCDTDGDGMVAYSDTTAVSLNYGEVHNKTSNNGSRFIDPPLYVEIQQASFAPSDTLRALIKFGNAITPVVDAYGLAFSLNFDPTYVNDTSIEVIVDSSWFAGPMEKISLTKKFGTLGKVDVGYSRIDQVNVSGHGTIGRISYVIIDNVDGKRTIDVEHIISISDVRVISNDGTEIPVFAYGDTTTLTNLATGIDNQQLDKMIKLYPNPANDVMYVVHPGVEVTSYIIADILGKEIRVFENVKSKEQHTLNLSGLSSGVYYLTISTDRGMVTKKLFVDR